MIMMPPQLNSAELMARGIPSGKRLQFAMENHIFFSWENSLFLWPFSVATLNYQRVSPITNMWNIMILT